MKKIVLLSISVLLLIAVACDINELDFEDLQEPPLQSLVAVPLGELTYSMRDLLAEVDDNELTINEDENTFITLSYFDTLTYTTSNDIVEIQDVSNDDTVTITNVPINGPFADQFSYNLSFPYPSTNQERLDEVVYESGEVELRISTNFSAFNISYNFEIEDTFDPSQNTLSFSGSSSGGALGDTQTQNISGYTTRLREDNGANVFDVNLTLTVEVLNGESIPPGSRVAFELTYRNQEFETVYGFFGRDTLNIGNQSLNLDFFSELGDDGIYFRGPILSVRTFNDIGVPVGLDFSGVYGIKADTLNGTTDTTFLETNGLQIIDHPRFSEGEVGQTIEDSVFITRNNSTIDELFRLAPDQLVFDISAISNPGGETGEARENFFQPGSTITSYFGVELPMSVQLRDLTREVEFDLGGGVKFEEADSVSLRLVTANLFPFSANLTLRILDENDEILYEAPETLVIATAFLNSDFIASRPEVQISNIPLSPTGIDALANGSTLSLLISLNTPESLNSRDIYVDLLGDYTLTVKVGVAAKLNVRL